MKLYACGAPVPRCAVVRVKQNGVSYAKLSDPDNKSHSALCHCVRYGSRIYETFGKALWNTDHALWGGYRFFDGVCDRGAQK